MLPLEGSSVRSSTHGPASFGEMRRTVILYTRSDRRASLGAWRIKGAAELRSPLRQRRNVASSILLHVGYNAGMMAGLFFATQHFHSLQAALGR